MAHVIFAQEMYFPLQSTQALSAYLKKAGHTTNLALGSPKEIVEFCKKEKSDLVAFSVLTSYRNHMLATADELKEAKIDTILIAGGYDITFMPQIIKNSSLDIICVGEGGDPIVELCNALDEGKDWRKLDVGNLHIKQLDGSIKKNPMRHWMMEMDDAPFDDRDIYFKKDSYSKKLKPEIEKAIESNQGVPMSTVRIRPPLPRPGKIICAAVNYLEFGTRPPSPLEAFIKSSNSVIGDGDTVELPNIPATIFHHEAELAVVIGKLAKNVTAAQSMDYVFGYTNFMDVSARGFAPLGPGRMSFFMIKSSDTFGPMGPCIVTKDEINDPHDLDVKLWNKGEIRHDFNTSDIKSIFIFTWLEFICHIYC